MRSGVAVILAAGMVLTAAQVTSADPASTGRPGTVAQSAAEPKPEPTGDRALIAHLMAAGDGRTRIDTEPTTGKVSFIGFPAGTGWRPEAGGGPEAVVNKFLQTYAGLFGVTPSDLTAEDDARPTPGAGQTFRYSQRHRGTEVFGAGLVVELDADRTVIGAAGKLVPDVRVADRAKFSRAKARDSARNSGERMWRGREGSVQADRPTAVIIDPALLGRAERSSPTLAWKVRVEGGGEQAGLVFIDADDGATITSVELAPTVKNRRICNNNNNQFQPAHCVSPVRTEGSGPSGVTDVDRAYDYLGQIYDFYFSRFGRDSIDGSGLNLNAVVRYCEAGDCPYANAYWDGIDTMVFGAGYVTDDVTAHEMTHGVTDDEAGLVYVDQSGAINESISDVFGELIDLTYTPASPRWKIGEGLPEGTLRDMANPGAFGQPDRLLSSLATTIPITTPCDDGNDFCGVHDNSGVGNKAAYLITDGGTFNGFTVAGLGIEKAAQVYYRALLLLGPTSRYRDLYNALQQGCQNALALGGPNAPNAADCVEVKDAVDATQMRLSAADTAAGAVQNLPECRTNVLPRGDDNAVGPVPLPLPFGVNFFGTTYNSLFISNNGNVSFDGPHTATDYQPFPLTSSTYPIIAPFLADVLTAHPRSDEVTYGASDDGTTFCVNWAGDGVAYATNSTINKLNRFQLRFIDRSAGNAPGDFDIVFNYSRIRWETGDQAGGSNGLGGNSARAGFSAGTGAPLTSAELAGSGVPGSFLDSNPTGLISTSTNSAVPGRHIFPIRFTPTDPVTVPGAYVPLNPSRVLDTRFGNGRTGTSPVPGNTDLSLQVGGRGGVPATGVSAVVLNVTVTQPQTAGYITVHADGSSVPLAANLNFVPNQTVPNLVVAPLAPNGKTALFVAGTGSTHLVADVAGYFLGGTPTAAGTFTSLAPNRLLDTRFAIGQPGSNPALGSSDLSLQVGGRGGVPAAGVSAVVLNVTVAQPQTAGYITVHADGTSVPLAANLNFVPNQTVPNLVVAPVAPNGKVALFLGGTGSAHLIADVAGYFLGGTPTAAGTFTSLAPDRLLDTRFGTGQPGTNPVPANTNLSLQVAGRGGVPTIGSYAAVVNVTVTQPTGAGYITAYPGGFPRPLAANLNFVLNQTVPNLVIVPVGADGTVNLFKAGPGTAHLVADVFGWFRRTNAP